MKWNFNTVYILGCTIVLYTALLYNRHVGYRVERKVENNRIVIDEIRKVDQEYIVRFTTRTQDRWDYLAKHNPTLNIPKVEEPTDESHFTDAQMTRK